MDWKTNVLLFVLVLFGSVVPVSAEDASGMTADVWAILGVGVILLGVLVPLMIHFNNVNRDAHTKIGRNIEGVKTDLGKNIDRVEGKVENGFRDLNSDIKDLNRSVGRVEGSLQPIRRPSETGQD